MDEGQQKTAEETDIGRGWTKLINVPSVVGNVLKASILGGRGEVQVIGSAALSGFTTQ